MNLNVPVPMLKAATLAVLALMFGTLACSKAPSESGRGFVCVEGSTDDGEVCSCRVDNPSELPQVDACAASYPCCLELASATEQQCACFSQAYLESKGARDPEEPREYGCEDEAAEQLTKGWVTAELAEACEAG